MHRTRILIAADHPVFRQGLISDRFYGKHIPHLATARLYPLTEPW